MKLKRRNNKKILIIVAIVLLVVIFATVITVGVINDANTSHQNTLTGIMMSMNPARTVYYVGDYFDPSGAKIQVLANSNEAQYFVDYTDPELKFSGFDSSVPNENVVITVTYREFTTTFSVKVIEIPSNDPYITGIRLRDDFKTTYKMNAWNANGPALDRAYLVCTYSDGSEKEVPMKSTYCYGIDRNITSAGTTSFTIKYSEGGIQVETVVTVTITE